MTNSDTPTPAAMRAAEIKGRGRQPGIFCTIFKKCSCCHVIKRVTEFEPSKVRLDGHGSRCIPCRRIASRKWKNIERDKAYYSREDVKLRRATLQSERSRNPIERQKINTRNSTRRAIISGRILRQPCEICGDVQVEAHHDDYSKRLEIRWLCKRHHTDLHRPVSQEALAAFRGEGGEK